MASKKKTELTLPTRDKIHTNHVIVKCERGHLWYVTPDTDNDSLTINGGCNQWYSWEEAFDHYKPRNWYANSSYTTEPTVSDSKLEQIRLDCIQRLKYLKANAA